jgi:spore maturation protein CgeB/glycosyltransferase involved in cell wall biosynthesis
MNSENSLVLQAADAFKQGQYLAAQNLYRQLAERLGEKNFHANLLLCQRRMRQHFNAKLADIPLKNLRLAAVMDEFTFHSYDPECQLLQLHPERCLQQLEEFKPHLLFIESAWHGKDGLWTQKISNPDHVLQAILRWCKERKVPTVFWNKEDPVHFNTFLTTARQFDYVFTTDIDCIANYKSALGHERVYLLPFACQPKVHNPIELYQRKDAFCFAGSYYVRYPERIRDLEDFIAELPKFKPLEIFDRYFGKDNANYMFPPEYQPYIVGTLPFDQIDKAYKGYRYSINLNTVKQSQSMFARRVYELLGSNTITISNFSRAVRLLFGDLVITSDSGKEIIDRLQRMSEEDAQKFRLSGLRKVMLEHTYQHRLTYVAKKVLGWRGRDALPVMVVVAPVGSREEYRWVIENYQAQRHAEKRLIVILKECVTDDLPTAADDSTISVFPSRQAAETRIDACAGQDEWLAPMSVDDYYGPNYLLDLAIATRYGNTRVIGKRERYQWTGKGISLLDSGLAYRPETSLYSRASVTQAGSLPGGQTLLPWIERQLAGNETPTGLAIDAFSYCEGARRAGDLSAIEAKVNDLALDSGLSIDELTRTAERIPPDDTAAEFEDNPKWNAARLMQVFNSQNKKHPQIDLVPKLGGISVRSRLPEGKHEYIYTPALRLSTLPGDNPLKSYLNVTPGLTVQYVFVFLDDKKQKISHVIHVANWNNNSLIPEGTAFVRIGWRFYGSGAATIRFLLWGHRKLEPAQLLGRGDVLVLVRKYPMYADFHRNSLIHSRVQAYKAQGMRVDVFCLEPQKTAGHYEFENVDVMTGSQGALRKMLDSGRYRRVLIHSLSPKMWEVLEHSPELQCIAWVHGAEIQPWYRRNYDYPTEQERTKAMRESEQRMVFWRGILDPMRPNLKLVFASRHFAEEVFEDMGFRLPEDRYAIIHNPIDTELFAYYPKPAEQRKRVLSIRPYASRRYANDLSVQAILKLSGESCFADMEFRLIGDGELFEKTLEPLRKFSNVTIERRFLSREEIATLQREYGIFLTPARWDSQGVSRDEAMSSGLVPITNAVSAIPEFVDSSCGILAASEDAGALAKGMQMLYENPERFLELSRHASDRVRQQTGFAQTIEQELTLINQSPIKILSEFKGGIGDRLFSLIWLQEFKKYFSDVQMDIHVCYISKNVDDNYQVLLRGQDLVKKIYHFQSKEELLKNKHEYDIVIDTYDAVILSTSERLETFEKLNGYIEKYKKERKISRCEHVARSIMLGKHRISKSDLNGVLKLDVYSELEIRFPDNVNLLKKLDLADGKFITIARSFDSRVENTESTKLWPPGHYNELVCKIKKEFPDYKVIQLGPSLQKNISISGVDMNLVGETSFSEMIVLLGNAFLHVDSEGGMVHLRHFFGRGKKKSVVLFGPTPKEYFGWPENVNISAQNSCNSYCVYLLHANEWQDKCMRGFELGEHPCMAQITPDIVMQGVREVMREKEDAFA